MNNPYERRTDALNFIDELGEGLNDLEIVTLMGLSTHADEVVRQSVASALFPYRSELDVKETLQKMRKDSSFRVADRARMSLRGEHIDFSALERRVGIGVIESNTELKKYFHNHGDGAPMVRVSYDSNGKLKEETIQLRFYDKLISYEGKTILLVQARHIKDGKDDIFGVIPGEFIERQDNISYVKPITDKQEREKIKALAKQHLKGHINFWRQA